MPHVARLVCDSTAQWPCEPLWVSLRALEGCNMHFKTNVVAKMAAPILTDTLGGAPLLPKVLTPPDRIVAYGQGED